MKHLLAFKLLLIMALAVFSSVALVGCGGDGDSGGFDVEREVYDWLDEYGFALEREDLGDISAIVSSSYFNQCDTRTDLLNGLDDLFDQYFNFRFEILSVDDPQENEDGVRIRAFVRTRTTASGGSGYSDTAEGYLVLRLEGGRFRLYGDQECFATTPRSKGKVNILTQSKTW